MFKEHGAGFFSSSPLWLEEALTFFSFFPGESNHISGVQKAVFSAAFLLEAPISWRKTHHWLRQRRARYWSGRLTPVIHFDWMLFTLEMMCRCFHSIRGHQCTTSPEEWWTFLFPVVIPPPRGLSAWCQFPPFLFHVFFKLGIKLHAFGI